MFKRSWPKMRFLRVEMIFVWMMVALIVIFGSFTLIWPHYHPNHPSANAAATMPQKYTNGDNAPQVAAPVTYASKYSVPILMYHYVRVVTDPKDKLGFNLSVTPTNFEAQVKWLVDQGYHTIPLSNFCQGDVPANQKSIILTFDDGYDDAYTAARPALTKNGFTGTFFIVKNFVNRPLYVTETQITQMQTEGMEIGAHTENHINLATATTLKQKQEIDGSKQSSPVFAYPAGKYSATTIQLIKEFEFKCAVTTAYGIATDHSPLFELPRVRISGGDSLASFEKKVEGKL